VSDIPSAVRELAGDLPDARRLARGMNEHLSGEVNIAQVL
jgi:hypothetical protein